VESGNKENNYPDGNHSRNGDSAEAHSQGFNISEKAIRHPVTTIMFMLTLIILGIISYQQLSVEYYPNITYPTVSVRVRYTGTAPGGMESLVAKPIEDSMSGISGVNHIRSFSRNGMTNVTIEFKLGKDIKDAANEVREKVAMIRRNLPKDIDEPEIARLDPDASPILNYAIISPEPLEKLTEFVTNRILPRLQQVDGVGSVELNGGQLREVQVTLNPDLLKKYGITPSQVSQRLLEENLDFPSGLIRTNSISLNISTNNAFKRADQIARLPIKTKSGQKILLKDLGSVIDGVQELNTKSILNGERAVVLEIQKQSGTNEVQIAAELDQTVKDLEKVMPPGMKIIKTFDTTKFILESKSAALEELIIGAILAVSVIFAFLRTVRGTIISAIAIPTSVISTYGAMYAFGFSLNTMTLLALSLVVGILVDDAVVDLENIIRYIQKGEKPFNAAIKATNEIGTAVVATTFSIVAVFVPIGFMKGITGQLFKEFGLTVVCAVIVSLMVARTLTPALAAYFLKTLPEENEENSLFHRISESYRHLLVWALKHRILIVVLTLSVFLISIPLAVILPKGFIPKSDRDEFNIQVSLAPGSTINKTDDVMQEIYERIKAEKYIKYILLKSGGGGRTDQGTIGIMLTSKKEGRKIDIFEIQKKIRKLINDIPGALISFREVKVVNDNSSMFDLNLSLQGDNLDELQAVADDLQQKIQKMPVVSDTRTSVGFPEKEISIQVDADKAADLGVSASALASTVRMATFGDTSSQIRLPSENIDIRVRLENQSRYNLKKLGNLGVPSDSGEPVSLNSVAKIAYTTGPSIITRYDRQRQIIVFANAVPGASLNDITQPVKEMVEKMNLPATVTASFQGDAQRMNDTFDSLVPALIAAIIFIYLILASQFEHFTHPFTIMMALPLSFMGAFLSLFIANEELGMMAAIGIIMLMGLVTKNSILLIDYTLTLRKQGMERNEALLTSGPVRLRPILMTTVAMIAGMTPIALKLTPGSEARAPMAIAVIGGLITSTLLTLVVIPVFYTLMDDFVNRITKKGKKEDEVQEEKAAEEHEEVLAP
jgi:HAE1 family hydrophobic/amphiphilic exporter-1